MLYDVFITTHDGTKLYWNDYKRTWFPSYESSTAIPLEEAKALLAFNAQLEPVAWDF